MKETGIIMSGGHPKLILDGIKTMTRRTWGLEIINLHPNSWHLVWNDGDLWAFSNEEEEDALTLKCPYGQVGDRLWVRETWIPDPFHPDEILYKADSNAYIERVLQSQLVKWKPSIHMFRKDSRTLLEITGLRAERLNQITEEDAIAEGANGYLISKFSYGEHYRVFKPYHKECYPLIDHADIGDIVRFQGPNMGFACFQSRNPKCKTGTLNIDAKESFNYVGAIEPNYRNGFQILWDSLNAKRGYGRETNPWVWPISFKESDDNL